jgi:SAM-dependent methyltransferase
MGLLRVSDSQRLCVEAVESPQSFAFLDALAHLDVIRMRAARQVPPGARRVLEAGCGEGAFLDKIPPAPGRRLFGVDRRRWGGLSIADFGLRIEDGIPSINSKSTIPNPQFTFVLADVARLPFRDGAFDAACCVNTLQVLDAGRARRAVGELARVCRAGGTVVATFPNRENPVLGWRMWRRPGRYQRWGNPHAFRASDVLRRLRAAGAEPTGIEPVRVQPYAAENSHQGTKAQRRTKEVNRVYLGDPLVSWCLGGKFTAVWGWLRRWVDGSPRRAPQLVVTARVR